MRGFCFALLLPALLPAAAQIEFEPEAGAGYSGAAIPLGVRATGMGEAYTAVADGPEALAWNPAGLSRLAGYRLGLGHNEWAGELGFRQESLGYGQQLSASSGFALGLDYLSLGQLDRRDSSGVLLGRSGASALNARLGYARAVLSERLRVGLGLGLLTQQLYDQGQNASVVDLGAQYDPYRFLRTGLALRRVGLAYQGAPPPTDVLAGVALKLKPQGLLMSLEAALPFQGAALLKAGAELDFRYTRLRAGYRYCLDQDQDELQGGLALGAGLTYGYLGMDYSFVPHDGLAPSHRIEATLALPADFFRPRLMAAEGTSVTAEAYYKEALVEEKSGETLKALFLYQRVVEAYPSGLKAQPQPFYVSAQAKAQELQEKLYKGGDRRQIQKLVNEALLNANKELAAGRHREALAVVKQAQQIDPENAELAQLRSAVESGIENRLKGSREAARAADAAGDLGGAVEAYRRVLAVDPADAEALGYVTRRRAELKALLQGLDRQAIYDYVGGRIEDAVAAWSRCEALDQFGDVDFKRNLDKARKQLALRKK